jgi:thiol:disulfide interchange protein
MATSRPAVGQMTNADVVNSNGINSHQAQKYMEVGSSTQLHFYKSASVRGQHGTRRQANGYERRRSVAVVSEDMQSNRTALNVNSYSYEPPITSTNTLKHRNELLTAYHDNSSRQTNNKVRYQQKPQQQLQQQQQQRQLPVSKDRQSVAWEEQTRRDMTNDRRFSHAQQTPDVVPSHVTSRIHFVPAEQNVASARHCNDTVQTHRTRSRSAPAHKRVVLVTEV